MLDFKKIIERTLYGSKSSMRFLDFLLLLVFFSFLNINCDSNAYSMNMPPKCSDDGARASVERIIQDSLTTYDNNVYDLYVKQIRTTDMNKELRTYRCLAEVVFYYRDSPSREQYFEYIITNEANSSFSVIVFGL